MNGAELVLIGNQVCDWEGIYVNGKLFEENHSLDKNLDVLKRRH
jgi:hypothetical protein